MPPSNASCGACKLTRRKCTPKCIFAPYFPRDQPEKFVIAHEAYGAANIAKLLKKVHPSQRQEAVDSLVYEVEKRQANPRYGCLGWIRFLEQHLNQILSDTEIARTELATYIGPQAMFPMTDQASPYMQQQYMGASSSSTMSQQNMGASSSSTMSQQFMGASLTSTMVRPHHGNMPMMEIQTTPVHGGPLIIREQQQRTQHPHQRQQYYHLHPDHHQQKQQFLEAQQLAIAMGIPGGQYDMIEAFQQQQQYQYQHLQQQQQHHQYQHQQLQQQQDFFRFNNKFEASGSGSSSMPATEFNQIDPSQHSLDLGPYQHQQPQHLQHQQQIQHQDFYRFNIGFEASGSGSSSSSVTATGYYLIGPSQPSLDLSHYQHQQLQQQEKQGQIQQQDFFRFNSGCEASSSGSVSGSMTATGFNQIDPSQPSMELSLYDDFFLIETHQQPLQTQQAQQGNESLQHETQQEEQMTQQGTERDEERTVEPS